MSIGRRRHTGLDSAMKLTRRSLAAACLLGAALVLGLSFTTGSAGALGVPSVKVPSVSVPSVSVPSIPTPLGNTPPVSTPPVSTPSVTAPPLPLTGGSGPSSTVSLPSVSTPSLGPVPSVSISGDGAGSSAGGGAGAPASSSSSATVRSAGGYSASSGSGSGAAAGQRAGASTAAGRLAARPAATARRAELRRQRELRRLVARLRGCLTALTARSRQVLQLRTGNDERHVYSASQVARRLHLGAGQEARAERAAVTELRRTATEASCGGSASIAMIQVPAQNRLVAVSPALAGAGQTETVSYPVPGETAGGSAPEPAGRVGAASAHRGSSSADATASIQRAAIGRLPTSSTPATLLVLGGIALLFVLALLSVVGRRLAHRQQPASASGGEAAAAFAAASTSAAWSPAQDESAWAPPVPPAPPAPLVPRPASAPAPTGETSEPVESAEPVEPAEPAPPPPQAVLMPAAPSPAVQRPRSPNQEWLRTHRSQIAIALAAAAGGALRVMARGRRRR